MFLKTRIDTLVERFCNWLNDLFPGDGGLALVGGNLIGLKGTMVLPVDKRIASNVHLMSEENRGDNASLDQAKGGGALATSCNYWAYCHMSGQPCVWCGGLNSLLPGRKRDLAGLCPKGKIPGQYWFGCCRKAPTDVRMIAFADCCSKSGSGLMTPRCAFKWPCDNWPDAKNWCSGRPVGEVYQNGHLVTQYDKLPYYCTVVFDLGACTE